VNVNLRAATPDDADRIGVIVYEAFKLLGDRHGFPSNFASPEAATEIAAMLLAKPGFYCVVAESEGHVIGCNFLYQRDRIGGIGPLAIDPSVHDQGVGTQLMRHVMDRAVRERIPGLRLATAAHNSRSICLYTKLGFRVREPLAVMQGPPLKLAVPGHRVRPASETDADACNRLCLKTHGHDRAGELADAIRAKTASVVERDGRITGYTTSVAYLGHSVARANEGLMALISAASAFPGPGFLLPMRNLDLFGWCLDRGLRLASQMTLMTTGFYSEPAGPYLASVLY